MKGYPKRVYMVRIMRRYVEIYTGDVVTRVYQDDESMDVTLRDLVQYSRRDGQSDDSVVSEMCTTGGTLMVDVSFHTTHGTRRDYSVDLDTVTYDEDTDLDTTIRLPEDLPDDVFYDDDLCTREYDLPDDSEVFFYDCIVCQDGQEVGLDVLCDIPELDIYCVGVGEEGDVDVDDDVMYYTYTVEDEEKTLLPLREVRDYLYKEDFDSCIRDVSYDSSQRDGVVVRY